VLSDSTRRADVVLPAAAFGEKSGTTTNLEGRVSRLHQKVTAPGTARADWMIAAELAFRLGSDLGLDSVEDIWDEIERLAPSHQGLTRARLASAEGLDGILAGGVAEGGDKDAPPSMSQVDSPGIQGALGHTMDDRLATTAMGSGERPAPQSGTQPAGAPEELGEAEGTATASGYAEGDDPDSAGAQADVVAQSVTAEHTGGGDDFSRPSGGGGGGGGGGDQARTPKRPAPLRWQATGLDSPPPPVDRYSLRLVSGRRLYDNGTFVRHSPSLAPLAPGPRLRVNPVDLQPLGARSSTRLQVTSSQGRVVLEAVADVGVPAGSVAVAFNQPGPGAADLIDAEHPVTDVRLETLSATAPGSSEPAR